MGVTFGPVTSHPDYQRFLIGQATLGSSLFGGRLFCKSLGIAWIAAPAATEVGGDTWNGTTNTLVGNKPCVSDWSSLNTTLTNEGLTPTQWFVPSISQLQSGYACRTYWDFTPSTRYWSSTECNALRACVGYFTSGNITLTTVYKSQTYMQVRAFRCVTY